MANLTTFQELPIVTALDGTEIVPLNQAGTTKTATTGQIAAVGALGAYTVATLPTGQGSGTRAFVSDSAASPTFADTLTGGGSLVVPVYFDGTVWRYG